MYFVDIPPLRLVDPHRNTKGKFVELAELIGLWEDYNSAHKKMRELMMIVPIPKESLVRPLIFNFQQSLTSKSFK